MEEQGDLKGALAEYQLAVQANPQYLEARNNLGKLMAQDGNLDGAISEYRAALTANADFAEAHHNLGVALLNKRNLDGAESEFRAAAKLGYAEAEFALGLVSVEKGNFGEAITTYQRIINQRPRDSEAHFALGGTLLQNGDLDAAVPELQEAVKLDPSLAAAYLPLGIALRQQGNLNRAISSLRTAARLDPQNPEVHYQLGFTLRKKGDVAGAEEELRRSLAIKADHLDAKYALGQTLQQRGARQQADTLFAELESQRRLDPDFQEARRLLDRGLGEVVGGQWVAARNSFQAALRYRPEYPEAHAQLGEIFLRLGEAESAIGHFRAAIDIKDDALTFYGLSRALTKRGDTVAAQEALRRARELDPEVGISGLAVRP
jgi:tetratricopeptide (TPR) repeat protein